ncbi:MAG: MBL fold metallo-hydrolase [Planctomycetes bacterium]|nr:MBL fold metallo-hydrolase [Planctomycetota bacterium]
MKLGQLDVLAASDGLAWFDGGGIFGVVPKPLWSRYVQADEKNRVAVGLNSLLIRTPSCTAIVDTGMGWEDWPPKKRKIYNLDNTVNLIDSLKKLGIEPGDIDLVLLTHLHIDHVGGCLIDGKPVFSKARHIVQKQEWHDATHPHPVRKGAYLPHQFMGLKEHGLLELIEGDTEIASGIRAVAAGGHTRGYQTFMVESEGKKLFFLGETVGSPVHIKPHYLMAYDLYPVDVAEFKVDIIQRGIRENWLFFFEHDPQLTFARFEDDGDGGAKVVPCAL